MQQLKSFLLLVRATVKSQFTHPLSLVLNTVAMILFGVGDTVGVLFLSQRLQVASGLDLPALLLVVGILTFSYSLCNLFFSGIEDASQYVRTGDFDRLLLRPLSSSLQLAALDLRLRRCGRLVISLFIIAYAVMLQPSIITFPLLASTPVVFVSLFLFFGGIFMGAGSLVFFRQNFGESINILVYGSFNAGLWPANIYRGFLRYFVRVILPVSALSWVPLQEVLEKGSVPYVHLVQALLLSGIFFLAGLALWRSGIRRYVSLGG